MCVFVRQMGLGLDRSAVPQRMDTVCNPDKQSRVRNLVYTGERVRKVRMSYLDTPDMQVRRDKGRGK